MIGLAWLVTAPVHTGDSLEEVAAFVMETETPLLDRFFIRRTAEVSSITSMTAAPVPMRGHFSMFQRDGVDGVMCVSERISLLTKIVLLMFIFSSSIFCSTICIL